MPHMNSAGDELACTDEIKVYKDEGEEEEQKKSSENLTEDKVGLVTEGEGQTPFEFSFLGKNGCDSVIKVPFASYFFSPSPAYANGAPPYSAFGPKMPFVPAVASPFGFMPFYVSEAFAAAGGPAAAAAAVMGAHRQCLTPDPSKAAAALYGLSTQPTHPTPVSNSGSTVNPPQLPPFYHPDFAAAAAAAAWGAATASAASSPVGPGTGVVHTLGGSGPGAFTPTGGVLNPGDGGLGIAVPTPGAGYAGLHHPGAAMGRLEAPSPTFSSSLFGPHNPFHPAHVHFLSSLAAAAAVAASTAPSSAAPSSVGSCAGGAGLNTTGGHHQTGGLSSSSSCSVVSTAGTPGSLGTTAASPSSNAHPRIPSVPPVNPLLHQLGPPVPSHSNGTGPAVVNGGGSAGNFNRQSGPFPTRDGAPRSEQTTPHNLTASERRKSHIKKPLNAFMLFMKEMRPRVQEECTLKESAAINQILGKKWHELPREDQAKYYELARKEKELHAQLFPGWSARDNYAIHTKRKKKRKLGPGLGGGSGHFGVAGSDGTDGGTDGRGGGTELTNPKKCRARFGLEHQNQWCKPCRRKKKCIRFVSDNEETPEDATGSSTNPATSGTMKTEFSRPLKGEPNVLRPYRDVSVDNDEDDDDGDSCSDDSDDVDEEEDDVDTNNSPSSPPLSPGHHNLTRASPNQWPCHSMSLTTTGPGSPAQNAPQLTLLEAAATSGVGGSGGGVAIAGQ